MVKGEKTREKKSTQTVEQHPHLGNNWQVLPPRQAAPFFCKVPFQGHWGFMKALSNANIITSVIPHLTDDQGIQCVSFPLLKSVHQSSLHHDDCIKVVDVFTGRGPHYNGRASCHQQDHSLPAAPPFPPQLLHHHPLLLIIILQPAAVFKRGAIATTKP